MGGPNGKIKKEQHTKKEQLVKAYAIAEFKTLEELKEASVEASKDTKVDPIMGMTVSMLGMVFLGRMEDVLMQELTKMGAFEDESEVPGHES